MPVQIHGNEYRTVAERIADFRESHPDWTIETQLIHKDEDRFIMKALIMEGEHLIATGYSEEIRSPSGINSTSALENCETSAVGRALAFYGLAGTEIRSADEMTDAVIAQVEKKLLAEWTEHTEMVEFHHESLLAIRGFLAEDNFDAAREAWNEVSNDEKQVLWRATTKGGWFTPRERQQMKWWSNDFETSRKDER